MRRILSLGISNPLLRVVVWMIGCALLSVGTLVLGVAGAVVIAALLFTGCGRQLARNERGGRSV